MDTFARLRDPVARLHGSVVLRLLATVFLFSCTVTLMLTAWQLYRDYDQGVSQIRNRVAEIDKSYRGSLGEALWRLDKPQLQLELDGIVRLDDISAAEVRENNANGDAMIVTAGLRAKGNVLAREFPIVYSVQGAEQRIGTLYVEATLADLYDALRKTALLILATQAANTFLVSLFTIYIFSRLVTRHLATLARVVGGYDFRQPPQPCDLKRRVSRTPDELDRVAAAFNTMAERLHRAYRDEREAAEERDARRAAEAANRAKDEFLASMSHELRTPLNGILGYAQLLQRDESLDDRQRERAGVIRRSGEHLLTLINDILDLARIESGKLVLEKSEVPLPDLLRTVSEIIRVKAEQERVDFTCEAASDVPYAVHSDERRLRQVLLNLLANAVRFTDRGYVSLHVRSGSEGRVRFEVVDTGIGIDEEQRQIIFEPFEQLGNMDRRAGGAGLGLAISRKFVRAMGSDIHLESRTGGGSTFWFELDAVHGDPVRRETLPARVVNGYAGMRRRVLVVDDVLVNREVLADMLGQIGFSVSKAADGADGLLKAQEEHPALILTDIVMRGVDGLEFTRRLRQLPGCATLPVIVISASASGSDEQHSLDAGADAFLPKPVDFDRLLDKMASLLKLEWRYAAAAGLGSRERGVDLPLRAPLHELENLYRLARLGDIREILQLAKRISVLDERYDAFAKHLSELARHYQTRAIVELVERYLNGGSQQ